MTEPRHLSWDNFKTTILLPGEKRVHRISHTPRIEVFSDGTTNRIGIWLELTTGSAVPPEYSRLTLIEIHTIPRDARTFLEIATTSCALQRQFYHFAIAVAERMLVEERTAVEAVSLELRCFAELLDEKPILGIERQLGLLGELLFLERLIEKRGTEAVDAWIGPTGEPHDFRVEMAEFEVKTTVSPQRIHTIHGTEQLVPSHRCSLYVVSILLGPPGAGTGFSLSDKVMQLRAALAASPRRLAQFTAALSAVGFRMQDSDQYRNTFSIRRPMALAQVDASFPAITRTTIDAALGALAPRIDSLSYDVSVEGLVAEDGTALFEEAFPS